MTIYQVLNEENQIYCEFTSLDRAIHSAHDLTIWDGIHYYHVEALDIEPASLSNLH